MQKYLLCVFFGLLVYFEAWCRTVKNTMPSLSINCSMTSIQKRLLNGVLPAKRKTVALHALGITLCRLWGFSKFQVGNSD